MTEKSTSGEHFVQCGFTALRDPETGKFLPSVPLYIKVDPEDVDQRTGMATCEKDLCVDIASVLAEKFGQYVRDNHRQGLKL